MLDSEIIRAAKLADIMCKSILNELENDSLEARFKVGCQALSSTIASFVNALIKNDYPDQKKLLVNDITKLSLLILGIKEAMRE